MGVKQSVLEIIQAEVTRITKDNAENPTWGPAYKNGEMILQGLRLAAERILATDIKAEMAHPDLEVLYQTLRLKVNGFLDDHGHAMKDYGDGQRRLLTDLLVAIDTADKTLIIRNLTTKKEEPIVAASKTDRLFIVYDEDADYDKEYKVILVGEKAPEAKLLRSFEEENEAEEFVSLLQEFASV